MENSETRSSCLLAPITALWRLVTWIVEAVGRFIAIVLGFVLMIIGVLISMTIIGLPVGIPCIIMGSLLVWRGLF